MLWICEDSSNNSVGMQDLDLTNCNLGVTLEESNEGRQTLLRSHHLATLLKKGILFKKRERREIIEKGNKSLGSAIHERGPTSPSIFD
jgi:hypothetical protein